MHRDEQYGATSNPWSLHSSRPEAAAIPDIATIPIRRQAHRVAGLFRTKPLYSGSIGVELRFAIASAPVR